MSGGRGYKFTGTLIRVREFTVMGITVGDFGLRRNGIERYRILRLWRDGMEWCRIFRRNGMERYRTVYDFAERYSGVGYPAAAGTV